MNSEKVSFKTSLTDLGFSIPTIARFKLAGIECLGDLVCHEEKITASAFASKETKLPTDKQASIDTLTLSGNITSRLRIQGYKTVGDVLEKSFTEVLDPGFEASKVHLMLVLIDLGYTAADGPLLNQYYFSEAIRYMKIYRILLRMDERGLVSKRFKVWFNGAIKGKIYNIDNRPMRKFKIRPFEIS